MHACTKVAIIKKELVRPCLKKKVKCMFGIVISAIMSSGFILVNVK